MEEKNLRLQDLIEIETLTKLLENLYASTQIPSSIIDMTGEVLVSSFWPSICKDYNRVNSESCKLCIKNETKNLDTIKPQTVYKCPHGLNETRFPIVIDGNHLANIFFGQFLTQEVNSETEKGFRKRARKYGFDEEGYIAALYNVSVVNPEKIKLIMDFFSTFALMVTQMGSEKLAHIRKSEELKSSEDKHKTYIENAPDGIFIADEYGNYLEANPAACEMSGYTSEELLKLSVVDLTPPGPYLDEYVILRKSGKLSTEMPLVRKDGSIIHISIDAVDLPEGRFMAFCSDISARKKSEEDLKSMSIFQQSVLETAAIWVNTLDMNGNIVFWNHAAEKISGYNRNEVVGNSEIWNLFYPDPVYREKIVTEANAILQRDKCLENFETVICCKNGEYKNILWHSNTFFDENGVLTGSIALAADITERKKIEDKLRKSEERFRTIFENAPVLIDSFDETSRCLLWNKECELTYGWTIDEINACEDPLELFHPDPVLREQVRKATTIKPEGRFRERESFTKAGKKIFVKWANFSLPDGDKIAIGYDITEQKKSAEALKESQERYETLSGLTFEGIILHDQGVVIDLNNSFAEMFGYERDDLIGENVILKFIPEEYHSIIMENIIKKSASPYEVMARRRSGEIFPIEIEARVVDYKDQALRVTAVRDITERKAAEEEKKELEKRYQQSQKMETVGQLAGGIAHDFNNLLTAITGHAELALMSLDENDPLHSDLQEITETSDRAAELTAQLLAFSRKQITSLKIINLNIVLENMDKLLRRSIGEDIDLVIIQGRELSNIKADPRQLEQVILNLAVNARDAMKNGGKLTIETKNVILDQKYTQMHPEVLPGTYGMLRVSDTGTGIDEETKSHIFEPFFTTKPQGKGTGLGLATVYGIVKQNKGHIWVESEIGIGTRFEIYFLSTRKVSEDDKFIDNKVKGLLGSETIMVVEDNSTVRESAVRSLQRFGYRIEEAASGLEAIELLKNQKDMPDLILSDVIMPNMNGAEFAKKLKAMEIKIPILFMSGYTGDVITHHGVLNPDVPYIQKPFKPIDLVKKVRETIDENGS
jgi:PAS domain S-box-containing protein